MYAVVTEEWEEIGRAANLDQAFAQLCCHAGVTYQFEQHENSWRLVLTDGERPECSPEPITSTYVKRADAYRDLIEQAVDGRLKGIAAVPLAKLHTPRIELLSQGI